MIAKATLHLQNDSRESVELFAIKHKGHFVRRELAFGTETSGT